MNIPADLPIDRNVYQTLSDLRAWSKGRVLDDKQQAQVDELLAHSRPFAIEKAVCRASQKQLDFAAAFFRREHDGHGKSIFAAIGANRSGKSFVGGWLCFALYLRERAQDGDIFWCVSVNLDRSILCAQRELWESLPRSMFGQQTWGEKIGFGGHRKVVLPAKNGGKFTVEFRSADQDPATFESNKVRGIWADEALPEEIFNRILARIIDLDGFILITDIRHMWWQEERLFGRPADSDVHAVQFCMKDNAHNLPPDAIRKARANMTADEARMRIDGESGLSEGLVFKAFKASQVIPAFAIPDYWPRWRAIDYGSSAPTACLWFTIDEEENVYVYREFYEVSPSVGYSARIIQDRSQGEEYRVTLIDPHAVDKPPAVYGMAKSVADQFRDAGFKLVGWPYIQTMGEHACVERIKLRDERHTIYVFDTCVNHIRERKNWKHKCDKDGKPLAADAYENDNSHSIDCLKGFLATNPTFAGRAVVDVVAKY